MSTLSTGTLGSGTLGNPGTADTPVATSGGLRAHGYTQRLTLPGHGHIHVTATLHGEGPVPALDGHGLARTAGHLTAQLSGTGAIRSRCLLTAVTGAARLRTRTHLTPVLNAELTRIIDPDEWLIFDLPELTPGAPHA